jgi:hypothetical protein
MEKTYIVDTDEKKIWIVLEDGTKHEMKDLSGCADCPALIGPCYSNCNKIC